MRCLYTSDLHGQLQLYSELVAWCRQEQVQSVLLGGDVLADARPENWRKQLDFVRGPMRKWLRWLQDAGVHEVGFLHGNHDWSASDDALAELEADGLIKCLPTFGWATFATMRVLSYAYTPPSPYYIKDFEKRDKPGDPDYPAQFEGLTFNRKTMTPEPVLLKEFLDSRTTIAEDLAEEEATVEPWLFLCHGPPKATDADLLWLPASSTGSSASNDSSDSISALSRPGIGQLHVGSESIARFIDRCQPTLSMHGHVHESPYLSGHYVQARGASLVINAGQRKDRLHAIIFDTSDPGETLWHTIWGTRVGPGDTGEPLPPRPSFCM